LKSEIPTSEGIKIRFLGSGGNNFPILNNFDPDLNDSDLRWFQTSTDPISTEHPQIQFGPDSNVTENTSTDGGMTISIKLYLSEPLFSSTKMVSHLKIQRNN
jgi:hypothetical protein